MGIFVDRKYNSLLHYRLTQGFTQVELLVTISISAVLFLAGIAALTYFGVQLQQNMASKTQNDIEKLKAKRGASTIFSTAGVSTLYMHLPIRIDKNCKDGDPCVREVTDQNIFASVSTSDLGFSGSSVSNIEFYRDHNGTGANGFLKTRPAADPKKPYKIVGTEALAIPSVVRSRKFYTTWPLLSTASNPFVVLKSVKPGVYFNFAQEFSTATPPAHQYVFFTANDPNVDVSVFQGTLMVVYNIYSQQHHTFQVIKNTLNCSKSSDLSACVQKANAFCAVIPNLCGSGDYSSGALNAHLQKLFAFELTSAQSDPKLQKYLPTSTSLGLTPDAWPDQNSAFYLFETNSFTFFQPSIPSFTAPIDTRIVAAFYSKSGLFGKLVAVPTELVAIYLAPDSQKINTQLVYSAYRVGANISGTRFGDTENTIYENVKGKMYFARRLGTNDISIFVFKTLPTRGIASSTGSGP